MKLIKLIINATLVLSPVWAVAQGFELVTTDNLPDLGRGDAEWADFNNDGLLDVAITGLDDSGDLVSGVYFNNGDETFSNSGAGIVALSDGSISVGDINNDGLMDLLITGSNSSGDRKTGLYKNEGSGVFSEVTASIEGVSFGDSGLGDFNNDGLSDLVITGIDNANERISRIYLNDESGSFSETIDLEGLSNGGVNVVNLNNDSYLDIIVNGIDDNNQLNTLVYHGSEAGELTLTSLQLPKLRAGKFAIADVNADGYQDVFVNGINQSGDAVSEIYTNNMGGGFVLLQSLAGLGDGSGAFGDYNGDGYPDLAYFGYNNPDLEAFIFTNDAGISFSDSGLIFPGFSNGSATWADFNNDQKIDLLLNGYAVPGPFNNLYLNEEITSNTAPSAPSGLKSTVVDNGALLEWEAGSDTETPVDGLTYELYVGSDASTMDVVGTQSFLTGDRKVVSQGVYSKEANFLNLPEGEYYWSVQSIDAAHEGSAFAAEEQFVICDSVEISASKTAVCPGGVVTVSSGTVSDQVEWFSIKDSSTPLVVGQEVDLTFEEKDTIYVEVTKPLGCLKRDTIIVDVLPVPAVDIGDDQAVCLDDEVLLDAGAPTGDVTWFVSGSPGNILQTGQEYTFSVTDNVEIVASVVSPDGCTNSDTVNVQVLARPDVVLDDIAGCPESEYLFELTGFTSVDWFTKKLGSVAIGEDQYLHAIVEDDTVWAEVTNSNGCLGYDTAYVTLNPLPEAKAGEDRFLCDNNQSVQLGIEGQDVSGLTFSWSPAASLDDPSSPDPVASPSEEITYTLEVTNSFGCKATDDVKALINPTSTIDIGADVAICIGESTRLGGDPTAIGSELTYTYNWSPANGLSSTSTPNPIASPIQSTTYRLVTSTGGCIVDTSYVDVTINTLPEIIASEDATVGYNEETTISASGGVNYEWFPEDGLDNSLVANPVAMPDQTTTYTVTGTDANGCKNSDSVTLTLKSEIFVPELFTPNGDGNNDTFQVYGFGIAKMQLTIYDNDGMLVFESDEQNQHWDGTVGGNQAVAGDYFWYIRGTFFDGSPIEFKGRNNGMVRLLR